LEEFVEDQAREQRTQWAPLGKAFLLDEVVNGTSRAEEETLVVMAI
jgi:hypothetical protein